MTDFAPNTPPSDDQPDAVSPSAPPNAESPNAESPHSAPADPEAAQAEPSDRETSDVERVRAFILATETEIIPELIGGETVADLLASVERSRDAYHRIRQVGEARMRPRGSKGAGAAASREAAPSGDEGTAEPPPTVPAGGMRPFAVDPNRLPPSEKIRRGLRRRDG